MGPLSRSLPFVSDPTSAWISQRIREAREQLGWTQAVLAEQLERTQTAVSSGRPASASRAWTT